MSRKPLEKGDKVVMHSCLEADVHGERVWTVRSNEWECSGNKVVLLEGFSGGFAVNFLHRVEPKPFALTENQLQKITPIMKDFLERLERSGLDLQNLKEDTIHFIAIDQKNNVVMRVYENRGIHKTSWAVDFHCKTIGHYNPSFELGQEKELVNRLSELYILATEPGYISTFQRIQDVIWKIGNIKGDAITLDLIQRGREIRQLEEAVKKLIGGEST